METEPNWDDPEIDDSASKAWSTRPQQSVPPRSVSQHPIRWVQYCAKPRLL